MQINQHDQAAGRHTWLRKSQVNSAPRWLRFVLWAPSSTPTNSAGMFQRASGDKTNREWPGSMDMRTLTREGSASAPPAHADWKSSRAQLEEWWVPCLSGCDSCSFQILKKLSFATRSPGTPSRHSRSNLPPCPPSPPVLVSVSYTQL